MLKVFEFSHGLALLGLMLYIGRTDFAQDYGYLGLLAAVGGFLISMRSETYLWGLISLWIMVSGISAVSGWMWASFLITA